MKRDLSVSSRAKSPASWLAAGWLLGVFLALPHQARLRAELPTEPMEIGFAPQFLLDNYVVDNHWAIKYKRQSVQRVFHPASKHPLNPLLQGDNPSHLWVVRDEESGAWRMYYQANIAVDRSGEEQGRQFKTYIAYAESRDGLHWEKPDLRLFPWYEGRPNNIVIARQEDPRIETCAPCLLEVPTRDRQGFRYLMLYRAKGRGGAAHNGIRLVGSHDGIHWDADSDQRIARLYSDCHNTISFDPRRGEYVMYCRAKQIYRAWGERMLDTGASRRVARMASDALWTDWLSHQKPQTLLVPDEIDDLRHFSFFYGMPTRYRHGIYWGFLEPFRMNDYLYTELAWSRDGVHFERLAGRLPLIQFGEPGTWDDEMILASPSWVQADDQWWIYYNGWDGPHGTADRSGGIGLAQVRKEGFVSLRGPSGGGVVCTRTLRWPGGRLLVNADARQGLLRVRVSDTDRRPLDGFDYEDCQEFRGDSVAHQITWRNRSIEALDGQIVRLEFFLQSADLYTFRASNDEHR